MSTTITCDYNPDDNLTVSGRFTASGLSLTVRESGRSASVLLSPEKAADMIAAIRTAADLPEVIEIPVSSLPEVTGYGTAKLSTLPEAVRAAPAGSASFAYADALARLAQYRYRAAGEAKASEGAQAARRDEVAVRVAREAGYPSADNHTYANLSPTAQAAVRVLIAAEEAAK